MYRGKAIYQPNGAAYEYCHWACNLFNGCRNNCDYCYNKHSMSAAVLGAETVSLKKSLVNEDVALEIFQKELKEAKPLMKEDESLFFSFVSDPMLPENRPLTMKCVEYALSNGVPIQILTKCADWVGINDVISILEEHLDMVKVGFTLTGMEGMESNCISNTDERIDAMYFLKRRGISTFASVEPVIDVEAALQVIKKANYVCDEFKVGFVSKMGMKFTKEDAESLMYAVKSILGDKPVLFKDSVMRLLE